MKKIDKFTIMKTLGEGAAAKVKLAQHSNGYLYALKIFDLSNKRTFKAKRKQFEAEARFCKSKIRHKNFVKYQGYEEASILRRKKAKKFKKGSSVSYIVQEYVPGEELFNYILETGAFDEKTSRHYFKKLILGLDYLH